LFLKSYTPFVLESYTLLLDAILFMEIEIEIIEYRLDLTHHTRNHV